MEKERKREMESFVFLRNHNIIIKKESNEGIIREGDSRKSEIRIKGYFHM